eukprot:Rhum_TRINITY_DN14299_c7_g1::Rhum_TRINITY_DN14299_c7_g1_i2::g.78357::m.78357
MKTNKSGVGFYLIAAQNVGACGRQSSIGHRVVCRNHSLVGWVLRKSGQRERGDLPDAFRRASFHQVHQLPHAAVTPDQLVVLVVLRQVLQAQRRLAHHVLVAALQKLYDAWDRVELTDETLIPVVVRRAVLQRARHVLQDELVLRRQAARQSVDAPNVAHVVPVVRVQRQRQQRARRVLNHGVGLVRQQVRQHLDGALCARRHLVVARHVPQRRRRVLAHAAGQLVRGAVEDLHKLRDRLALDEGGPVLGERGAVAQDAQSLLLDAEVLVVQHLQQLREAVALADDVLVVVVDAADPQRRRQLLQHRVLRLVEQVHEEVQPAQLLQRHLVLVVDRAVPDRTRRVLLDVLVVHEQQLQQGVQPAELPDGHAVLAHRGAVPQGAGGVLDDALDGGAEQLDERLQPAQLADQALVLRVDGAVPQAARRVLLHALVLRAEQVDEGRDAAQLPDDHLVVRVRRAVPQRTRRLALDALARVVQGGDQLLESVALADGDLVRVIAGEVAEGDGGVLQDHVVLRVQQVHDRVEAVRLADDRLVRVAHREVPHARQRLLQSELVAVLLEDRHERVDAAGLPEGVLQLDVRRQRRHQHRDVRLHLAVHGVQQLHEDVEGLVLQEHVRQVRLAVRLRAPALHEGVPPLQDLDQAPEDVRLQHRHRAHEVLQEPVHAAHPVRVRAGLPRHLVDGRTVGLEVRKRALHVVLLDLLVLQVPQHVVDAPHVALRRHLVPGAAAAGAAAAGAGRALRHHLGAGLRGGVACGADGVNGVGVARVHRLRAHGGLLLLQLLLLLRQHTDRRLQDRVADLLLLHEGGLRGLLHEALLLARRCGRRGRSCRGDRPAV